MTVDVFVPGLRLPVLNDTLGMHRMKLHRIAKKQKCTVALLAIGPINQALRAGKLRGPLVVTITRYSPGKPDDDGAVGSGKWVRDSIAKLLGVDDGDPRVTWKVQCSREKPSGNRYAVAIRIEEV